MTLHYHNTHSPLDRPYQNFLMPNVSHTSCEVGLFSLIGRAFEFGVNRFEKEYLRKCAFWQRLQAGMYGAHVSLESGVKSLGSPLESVPLPNHLPHPPATRLLIPRETMKPDTSQNIHVTPACAYDPSVSLSTHKPASEHVHIDKHGSHAELDPFVLTQTWKSWSTPMNVWNEGKKETGLVILNIKNICIKWTFELHCIIKLK